MTGLAFCASILCLGFIAGGFFLMRLAQGPVVVDLGPQIAAALQDRVGGGYRFAIGSTVIEQSDHGPTLMLDQLTIRDRGGRTILAAPRAGVGVDVMQLALGKVSPKRLEVQDILLRVIRLDDGTIAVSAGQDQSSDSPSAGPDLESGAEGRPIVAVAPSPGGTPTPDSLQHAVAAATGRLINAMNGPGSPVGALDRFGIRRGRLIVEDRLRHVSTTYRNFTVDFDRQGDGGSSLTAGADGPAGHWSVSSKADRATDGSGHVAFSADHLSIDEVALVGGIRASAFDTDMPLSFDVDLVAAPDGALSAAYGRLRVGAGYFRLDDPDHEPAMVDGITADMKLDPATGQLIFDGGELRADKTTFSFGGLAVPPASTGEPWHLTGTAHGVFGAERPGEKPIILDHVGIAAEVLPEAKRVTLNKFELTGPAVNFKMQATFQANPAGGFLVTSNMEAGRMPGIDLLRLWPNWVASPPRAWFLANLKGGTLDYGRARFALTDVDLETMRHQRSVPDDHSRIEFGISDVALTFMAGVPPLKSLDGEGVITGDTVNFLATRGELETSPGHKLSMADGSFTVASMDPKPTPASIGMRITGKIDTLADLLSRDALKPYANLPLDTSAVRGDVEGNLTIGLKLGDRTADDTKVGVVATATDFHADKVIGKEPLDGATLNIVADKLGLHARGEGRMFGAPATIDLKKNAGGAPSEAVMSIVLDEAARAKAGFSLGKSVTGPISAKISTTFTPAQKNKAAVELDLTRAVFDSPVPGLKKAAGRPSKASFTVTQQGDETQLDQVAFESGGTLIRGTATLDADGSFRSAKLGQVRLSPGDDMRADLTRTADGLRIVVRGSNIDARPFLKAATGADGGRDEPGAKDLDLDLHANVVTGQNSQALTGTDLRLSRHNGQFRRVQMTGRLGRGTVSVSTVGQGPGASVVIAAQDAGAALSFLDLYKRMDAGRLDLTLKMADGRIDGTTVIHDFTIKEDPAIKKLAQEEIPSNSRNAGARIDPSAVNFSKLEALFSRSANNVVEIRQGAMFGPQLGATVEGSVDFAHDKVALSGTFVPVYGLNNLFSQIPVVGMLLGGGTHEGLFALNYRINGTASSPVLSFNPLSALAPGIFRKIFGAIDDAAQQGDQPAGTRGHSRDPSGSSSPSTILPE